MALHGLERRLENMVEGVFRRSSSRIRPIELGRRLLREMDDHRTVDVSGGRIAPNHFVVELSADDHTAFTDMEDALRIELVEACREYARAENYNFVGPVAVDIQVNNELRPGRFGIVSTTRQADDGLRPGTIVLPTGERVPLGEGDNIIGRLDDCTIQIDDTNTSRQHASINRAASGFTISDMQSTNGTFVNGARIGVNHRLVDGDIITAGAVNLRFETS